MQFLISILQKIITNPRFEAFVIIGLTSLIRKKFMEEQTQEAMEANAKQPLFLPRGSVRAILTLVLTLIIGGSFIWHYELSNEFYAMALLAIGYYVGYRTDNSQIKEIKQ